MLVNLDQLCRISILLDRADNAVVALEDVPAHFPRGALLARVDGECFLIDRDGGSQRVDRDALNLYAGAAP